MGKETNIQELNVYQKLAKARLELQKRNLQKSGNNKYAGFTYFELADFMPAINEICESVGLITIVSFSKETAVLGIINTDNPSEVITFESPMAEAELKGCHPIQNIGAVETYQRRYLMMMAFEIVENDVLDPTTGQNIDKNKYKLSIAQINRLYAIAKAAGIEKSKVDSQVNTKFKLKVGELSKEQYEAVVTGYEKMKASKEEQNNE